MKLLFHFLLWRCSIEAESEMRLVRLRLLDQVHVHLCRKLGVSLSVVIFVFFSSIVAAVLEDIVEAFALALVQPLRKYLGASPSIGLR